MASCSIVPPLKTLRNIVGFFADLWAASTSLTAPIHLDKSCDIDSKSLPAAKALLIPLNAVLAVATAAEIVTGSNILVCFSHFQNDRICISTTVTYSSKIYIARLSRRCCVISYTTELTIVMKPTLIFT